MRKRVVITGLGLVTPLGMDVETVWRRILAGESGIRRFHEEAFQKFRSRIGGMCDDFTTEGYLLPKDVKKFDRFALYAMTSAMDAVKDSGIDFAKEDASRCGAIIGTGVGGLGEIEHQQDRLRNLGPQKVSPFTIPRIMGNAPSGHVAIHYQLHGPTFAVSTACASANNAMIEAYRSIALGETDIVITGGAESAVTELGLVGFCAMRALSERNDAPHEASRPFDLNRDGFVISEGGGILVFEELEHAKKRGAKIFGEFLGYGVSTDACHITQPDNEGIYAGAALSATLKSAGLSPDEIDYINLHGTATKLGDIAETAAIKRAMGDAAKKIPLSSTKSHIGHLLGGSGGVEAIFTLLAIRDGVIPPTINLTDPDPLCDLDFTPLVPKERKVEKAISNSFGFWGHNSCVALGKFVD